MVDFAARPRSPSTRSLAPLAALLLGCTSHAVTGLAGSTSAGGSTGTGGAGGSVSVPDLDPSLCAMQPASEGEDPTIAGAAAAQFSIKYVAPTSGSIEQDKAFPLATLLQSDPALMSALAADATLSAIGVDRDARLRAATAKCGTNFPCYSDALAWTAAEASTAADAITARLASAGKLAAFAKDALRPSGRFALHAPLDDAGLVKAAFEDLVAALAATLGDESASLDGAAFRDVVTGVVAAHPSPLAFFEPLLDVDLAALLADKRDEAERYEPLTAGENAKALAHIPSIDWSRYTFTCIIVPGEGPGVPGVVLDPTGQDRVDLAAARFAKGLAPLILMSGGHVHPDRTPYAEAMEMKKYLLRTYAVPEEAVLVDPHARHTTTNLRNASRLLYRSGVPTDRPALITSDFAQSLYIAFWHGTFGPRCMNELGYEPWRALVRLSTNDACMLPVAVSLQADGRDPLDP